MFLYFLQKKEFLAGDRKFLTTQYQKLKLDSEDTDYYIDVLEPLFFETLNKCRPNGQSPWGKIPYLNGGLFNRDYGADILDSVGLDTPEKIEIPNSLFDPGNSNSVLNFFNSYNFTISENVEGDEDVAVDPEMLGKVFENMLEVEERGKSGTFYTPRGIVHFMCTEVLSRYLSDETGMDLETVKKIIEFDPEQPASYFKELISPQQARKLKQALSSLKCLDPAVGSAAFPMGMMQVILNAYQSIAEREGNPFKRGSLAMSKLKRNIIANNLYGVDIKPEAIEIAKLRMWLSLVVDIPDIDDVEPLPNLEYKLMCGDSLISTINGEVLIPDPVTNKDAIQLQLKVTPIQQAIQPLLELQQQYFDAQSDERSQLRKQILEAEANIFRVAIAERRSFWASEQQKLNKTIGSKSKLTKNLENKKAAIATQISELDNLLIEVENRKRSLSFFQYYLHFRDVFEVKGGFDIIIGNPPYGIIYDEERKNSYELTYSSFLRNNDIYVAFYEKGINLLSNSGHFSYITPNTFLNGDYFKKLRNFLTKNTKIKEIRDYKEVKVFDDPTVFVCVFVGCKQESISYPYKIKLNTAKETINEFEANAININEASESELKPNNTLLDKLSNQSRYTFLDELFFVKDVGFNYWTKGGCKKRGGNSIGKRVFYKGERQNLKDVPFLKGRNVEKWLINSPNNYLRHNYQDFLNKAVDTLRFSSNYLENEHKVVYRQTANKIIASIDTNSLYLDKTVHLIVPKENWNVFPSHLLLGILNSKLLLYIYTYISQETEKRAFSQVKTTYIKKIPVPKNWDVFTGKKIIHLVKEIIQLKEKDNTQDLTNLEKAIDTLVYSLYDLTSEEIAIIENHVNTQT